MMKKFWLPNISNLLLFGLIHLNLAQEKCADNSMECIPLKQCSPINKLSVMILEEEEGSKRQELFDQIREKFCGDRSRQLFVCCPKPQTPIAQEAEQSLLLEPEEDRSGRYLGSFKQLTFHPVGGDLTIRDEQTFRIRNFVYDGEGPDVFFIVGLRNARPRPNPSDAIPVPYPAGRLQQDTQAEPGYNLEPRYAVTPQVYRFDDPDIPILGRFDGQDIDLRLPNGIGVNDVKWISLYCRKFGIDFGHVKIGSGDARNQRWLSHLPRRT